MNLLDILSAKYDVGRKCLHCESKLCTLKCQEDDFKIFQCVICKQLWKETFEVSIKAIKL